MINDHLARLLPFPKCSTPTWPRGGALGRGWIAASQEEAGSLIRRVALSCGHVAKMEVQESGINNRLTSQLG